MLFPAHLDDTVWFNQRIPGRPVRDPLTRNEKIIVLLNHSAFGIPNTFKSIVYVGP